MKILCSICNSEVEGNYQEGDIIHCESCNEQMSTLPNKSNANVLRVSITEINIPFGSLVLFMLKASIAAIPVYIVMYLLWLLLSSFTR